MIKKSLLISVALIVGIGIMGQNDFKKEWNIGASFGLNMSDVDFATSLSEEPFKTFFWMQGQAGLSVRYITENHLGFIIEANFIQQGWVENFDENDDALTPTQIAILSGVEHKRQLNYLEIPFLTHIYFGNKVRFFINIGPKIGFLLGEKETFNQKLLDYLASGEMGQYGTSAQYFKKAERKFDYGIMGGLGLEFRTGIGSFALEGRYTFGLGDIYKNSKSDPFQRSANRSIGMKMTYYIKLF